MKIGVLFNCQGQGLTASLRAMLPDAEVHNYSAMQVAAAEAREAAADALMQCDVIFSRPLGAGMGRLSTGALRHAGRTVHVVPPLRFRGFHPDQILIQDGAVTVAGPTDGYHSRIAVAAFLAGLTPAETAALYHKLVFARLGYLRVYDEDFVLLEETLAEHELDGGAVVARLRGAGCFMHSCTHPKPVVSRVMAEMLCGVIGVAPRGVAADAVPDFLVHHGSHPVFEDIAAACGVAPEGMFRAPVGPGGVPEGMDTETFVARSFALYQDMDRGLLRRANGVAEAMAALDLAEHAPAAGRSNWGRGMALMTWHGTLLRHAAEGAAMHLPLSVPETSAPLLRADLNGDAAGETLPERLGVLGGVALREAVRPNTLGFVRGRHWLSAGRESASTFFLRDAVGDWESFLPVTDEQLDVLQMLLSGEWAVGGAGEPGPARLESGPAVYLGAGRIDLVEGWPRVLPDGADGSARLAVRLDGMPAVLRQTVKPVARAAPVSRKIALDQLIVLAGKPVFLPLPVTLSNADRRWLHEACGDEDGLPWRDDKPEVSLQREADLRLVGVPPVPGEALPDQAVLDGAVALVAAPGGAAEGWAAPLLRLLALAPYLAAGTQVLAPGGDEEGRALAQAWEALGLPPIDIVTPPAGLYVARDVVWLNPPAPCRWPGETLQSARGVVLRGAAAGEGRVFLQGAAARRFAGAAALEEAVAALDFTVVDIGAGSPGAQLARLRDAGLVVGMGEDLLVSAFCPEGTKIIELCGEDFVPDAWLLSCRLGMTHAVLPRFDAARLDEIVRLLKFRS